MKRQHQYTCHPQKTKTKPKHRTCKITNQPNIRETNEKTKTILRQTSNTLGHTPNRSARNRRRTSKHTLTTMMPPTTLRALPEDGKSLVHLRPSSINAFRESRSTRHIRELATRVKKHRKELSQQRNSRAPGQPDCGLMVPMKSVNKSGMFCLLHRQHHPSAKL